MNSLRADGRGVVMMEFMMALLPVMLAFLGFTQFCFAGLAKLSVRHAAQLAARAAVVVIEESKDVPGTPDGIYNDEKAGLLETSRPQQQQKGSAASVNQAQNQIGSVGSSGNSNANATQNMVDIFGSADRTDSRIKQIRTAAYIPLIAISPSLIDDAVQLGQSLGSGELFPKLKVRNAIGKAGLDRIAGALLYNLGAVAVTFPNQANGTELASGLFGDGGNDLDQMVTTRVTYLFRCQVPLASLLMCASGWSLMFGDAWVDPVTMTSIANLVGSPPKNAEDLPDWADKWKQQKTIHDRQQRRVDAYKGHEKEFREVEWPFMLDVLLAMPGSRYLVLTADAQLPLQGAKYYPRAGADEQKKMWDEQDKQRKQGGQMPDLRGAIQPVADAAGDAARQLDDAVGQVQDKIDEIETAIDKGVGAAKAKVNEVKTMTKNMVDQARSAYNDVKEQVDDKVEAAKDTFDSAKKQAQASVDGVKAQANQIKDDAQAKLDDAKAELREAKKQGQAAVAEAQRKVDDAQRGLNDAKTKANGMVADAQRIANQKIATAQTQLDQVKADGQALLDDAKANLADARQTASDLNKEANQTLADAKRGAGAMGQNLQRQAGQALNGLQSGASKAGSALGDSLQDGVQSAGKSVSDALKDTTKSMPGMPGMPGSMSVDQF